MGIEPTWERLHAPTPDLKSGLVVALVSDIVTKRSTHYNESDQKVTSS